MDRSGPDRPPLEVTTRAAYSGPEPALGVTTMAKGSWLPGGGATVIAIVCCGATCTVCGGASMDWLPAEGTTVTVADAAPAGADSSRPTVSCPLAGFPAMIPCSVTGA